MAGVIWMPGEDCGGTINLLSEDETRQRVCHRHGSQREQQRGALAGNGRPAISRSDGKHQVLRTVVAPLPQPGGKGLGTHGSSATIEEDNHWCRSTLKLVDPLEQRLFVAKGLGAASSERRTALQIEVGQLGKAVF